MLLKRLKSIYKPSSVLLLSLFAAVGAVAGAAATDCPEAESEALQWLDRMSRSLRQVSYQGVVTLQRGDEMQVMQISHTVDGGISSERLTELTGQGAQVERDYHPVECVHPGDRLLRLEALSPADRCGITMHYRFTLADDERVAGRNTVRIKIEPRDMYRFGYMMALDRETGILLKSQIISHGHQVLETMQFADLSYADVQGAPGELALAEVEAANAASDSIAVVHEAEHSHNEAAQSVHSVARAWVVGWLPRGFSATDASLGNSGRRTYTDGLSVFSVFLEDLNIEIKPGEGLVRQGGTITYTRGLDIAGQPVLVTVIGEVPANTARMVANSVSWVK
ncbi:Sigma factor AlgU regulatory protein MucB [Halioglobus japonicus]|nr:Sigma factor AlgU regulatory protein MucB [Halioglobus japonicus]